jgi:hypothetical protein
MRNVTDLNEFRDYNIERFGRSYIPPKKISLGFQTKNDHQLMADLEGWLEDCKKDERKDESGSSFICYLDADDIIVDGPLVSLSNFFNWIGRAWKNYRPRRQNYRIGKDGQRIYKI